MYSKRKINKVLPSINDFLIKSGKRAINPIYTTDKFLENNEVYYKRNELTNVILNSIYISKNLLKDAKNYNYKSVTIKESLIKECRFQIEYITLLLRLGIKESDVQSLGIPYATLITYFKRSNNQECVINLAEEAILSKINYKYMDFLKEFKLAQKRLNK